MSGCCSGDSMWGVSNKFLKFYNGDLVAVNGSSFDAKLILNDLRIPYTQIATAKVVLKKGAVNYLLNYLGVGDNCTFLAVVARYNTKSVNEEDNYIMWNYYDDPSKTFPMGKLLMLTGNSTHRIKQIYLTNPNADYDVELEVMVGVVDNSYNYFPDTEDHTSTMFKNLTLFSIGTHVVNEIIVLLDNNTPVMPLAYISIIGINIARYGTMLTIDEPTIGKIYMDFKTEWDAKQAHSLLHFATSTEGGQGSEFEWDGIIENLNPREDAIPPTIYFRTNVNNGLIIGDPILLYENDLPSPLPAPYNTTQGLDFRTSVALNDFSMNGLINKTMLINFLITNTRDNRDGLITLNESNLILRNSDGYQINIIGNTGEYTIEFVCSDIAGNFIPSDIIFTLTVTLN